MTVQEFTPTVAAITGLHIGAMPVDGREPIGRCLDDGGEVYLVDNAGTAECVECERRWRVELITKVTVLP